MLVAGLVVFFGVHLVPYTRASGALRTKLGPAAYRGAFSLVSLAGIVLIAFGYAHVPVEFLFEPAPWGRGALFAAMPFVLILFAAANMPTHIRAVVRHPMMLGTLIWAGLHYMANGERAASYLFGAFALYAVISIAVRVMSPRPVPAGTKPVAWKYDAMAVVGGLVVYAVLGHLHGWLFGVALV